MIIHAARVMLSEWTNVVNPWRKHPAGVLLGLEGLHPLRQCCLGSAADQDQEDPFGSLWFAVPKKRVSLSNFEDPVSELSV